MTAPYPQVVLFGDSLLQDAARLMGGFCFQAALQEHCIRRFDVVNRGLSGYNTSNALRLLPEIFPPLSESVSKIKYLIVLLGANDAALKIDIDNQHVDLDKYQEYLKRIITHERIKAHKPTILLVTPPPLDEIRRTQLDKDAGLPIVRHTKISAEYSDAARKVAASVPGVILIDLHKAIMDVAIEKTPGFDRDSGDVLGDPTRGGKRGYLETLLPDGLHMNGEAYSIFFDAVRPHIKPGGEQDFVYLPWRQAPWLEE